MARVAQGRRREASRTLCYDRHDLIKIISYYRSLCHIYSSLCCWLTGHSPPIQKETSLMPNTTERERRRGEREKWGNQVWSCLSRMILARVRGKEELGSRILNTYNFWGRRKYKYERQTVADLNNYCSVKPKSQETATLAQHKAMISSFNK